MSVFRGDRCSRKFRTWLILQGNLVMRRPTRSHLRHTQLDTAQSQLIARHDSSTVPAADAAQSSGSARSAIAHRRPDS